jgi:aryl-alcohol dehydrogenase-like predicted oxidoreductase
MRVLELDWARWTSQDYRMLIRRTEPQSLPILKAAYDKGLNTWDTANVYSNGVSEEIIGKAIKKYNIPRQKLVILTKCFGTVGEELSIRGYGDEVKKSKDYVNQFGMCHHSF